MNSSQALMSRRDVLPRVPTPMTDLFSSLSLSTSGVKSESPDTMTNVST